MERERQRAVETLSEDYAEAKHELELSRRKMEAARARARVIENENARQREQVKVLIGKGDTDNDLIDALRDEVQKLRQQLHEKSRKTDAHATHELAKQLTSEGANAPPDSELARLRRENKRQQEQLERQERMLRDLRADLTKANRR